jgi:methionine-rich copper-binding protein CopC
VVGSSGPGTTAGTITVVDTPPAGLTITGMSGNGWTCTVGTATCTTTAALASGGTLPPITVTVNVSANASSPLVNAATVSAAFDPGTAGNNRATDSTVILGVPDLTVAVGTSNPFVQGGTGAFLYTVINTGAGASSGAYSISSQMPTGLTLRETLTSPDWDCSNSTSTFLSCVRTTAIPASVGAPIVTAGVNIAANAPSTMTNTVVVSGGGEVNTSNNSGSVTFSVAARTPVTVNVPAGVSYTFNGQTVTGSQTFQVAPGTYVLSTTTPQSLGAGTRAVFASWSNGGAIAQNLVVGSSALTITGNFTTQHQLTMVAGTGGTVTPASGTFFDAGTVVNVSATPSSGFNFASWTGPVANANAAATTVTMSAPASVTANFTAQTGVTINVPAGVSYTFNGQTVTGSQTFQVAPGTYVLSTTTPQTLAAGTRAVFANWSNGGAISQNVVVGSSALTITGTFTTQHQLTMVAGTGGTVTPASSGTFFDAGTVVNVAATPSSGFNFASWTGPVANASAASTTVTMSAPVSVTANFTAQTGVTINVPAGVSYTFNGQTVTGSQTFQVAPGTYVLSTTTPQSLGAGTRAVFASWSNGGAIAQNLVVGSSALTITGNFTTQHQLTMVAGTGGTVTPASGTFFDAGTVVNVSATPSSGFNFASWTGPVANANAASTTVTMSAPASVTANFTAQTGVTINVPAGVSYTFNGQTVTGSQTFQVAPGTYVLSTTTPQTLAAGTRAVFASWSNGGAISQNVVVGSSALTITGNVHDAAPVDDGGGDGWYGDAGFGGTFFDAGTVVNVAATPSSGFNFASWTGPVANASAASTTVTMSAPASVTANFTAQTGVTINVPAGVSYTFNGQTVTGSQTFQVAPGTYVLSTTTPQTLAAGTRAVFASWSNGGAISQNLVVGSSALTITGNFTTQHQLTMVAGTGGTVTPASGTFFDAGTVVNVSATASSGFNFASWTGPVANANAAATTVTMSAPASVTANFTSQTGVTINVPAGVSYTFNGQTVTGSQTFQVAPGTYVLSTTTPQSLGAGTRAVFASWSNGGAISQNLVVGSSALTITGTFTTQHQLTTAAGTGGTVTPASGTFFDAGTVVNVAATPSSGFNFASWTGPVANANAAATTVTMSAPATVTANFTAQTGVTINVPAGVSYTFNGQTVTGSQTFQVAPGTYVLSTTTPQTLAAGTRAVFASWSNGGAIAQNLVVGSSALTITGTFTTQHQLTTAAGTGGTVTPASGTFFDAGTVVNVSATASSGFNFASWTGPVANASAASTTVVMNAPVSVSASFAESGPAALTSLIAAKSGPANARVWSFRITNTGTGSAVGAMVNSLTLVQQAGAACTPVITSPLPAVAGTIAPGGNGQANVTIDFSSCAVTARFRANWNFSANSGAATGTTTLFNQFQ